MAVSAEVPWAVELSVQCLVWKAGGASPAYVDLPCRALSLPGPETQREDRGDGRKIAVSHKVRLNWREGKAKARGHRDTLPCKRRENVQYKAVGI